MDAMTMEANKPTATRKHKRKVNWHERGRLRDMLHDLERKGPRRLLRAVDLARGVKSTRSRAIKPALRELVAVASVLDEVAHLLTCLLVEAEAPYRDVAARHLFLNGKREWHRVARGLLDEKK